MNRLLTLTVVACALMLAGCERSHPTIILDGWWLHDFGKSSCLNVPAPQQSSCNDSVQSYEDLITTAFAANPRCKTARFLIFSPDRENKGILQQMGKGNWFLIVDFDPNAQKQSWSLGRDSKSSDAILRGAGTVDEIARKVCAIASGDGASING